MAKRNVSMEEHSNALSQLAALQTGQSPCKGLELGQQIFPSSGGK